MTQWFYRLNGANQGPVSEADLIHIFDCGVLSYSTPVWCEGMEEWIEYQKVQLLSVDQSEASINPEQITESIYTDSSLEVHTYHANNTQQGQQGVQISNAIQEYNCLKCLPASAKTIVAFSIIIAVVGLWGTFNKGASFKTIAVNSDHQPQTEKWNIQKDGLDIVLKAAERGDAEAQFTIGLQFDFKARLRIGPEIAFGGKEALELTWKEAFKWVEKSANQGFDKAQFVLGNYYLHGLGAEVDLSKATKWYKKAADKGFPQAIAALKELDYIISQDKLIDVAIRLYGCKIVTGGYLKAWGNAVTIGKVFAVVAPEAKWSCGRLVDNAPERYSHYLVQAEWTNDSGYPVVMQYLVAVNGSGFRLHGCFVSGREIPSDSYIQAVKEIWDEKRNRL